ncbi:hypothetical protein [Amycolatopsis sp. FDAARGOS 1241]|uniref:hypothetical protein n=1 Tax=Amycolatopsis sp. FDAARGOS 1241 TaxID=2778070 RepID=UPI00195099EA|nr:hypothetical protein [Amycolatopsis sp. FDAARGOS 1241]QRP50059.1 hypothetical protein I6J71_21470 [Amycolatopsis sp. FDAARGOS 1241]
MIVTEDVSGDLEWIMSVGSSVVRAHRHAAGPQKGCSDDTDASPSTEKDSAGPAAD